MADIFEILKGSNGKLDAKEIIHEEITKIISNLFIYKEMFGLSEERKAEKYIIESIRSDLTRVRWAVNDFLKI